MEIWFIDDDNDEYLKLDSLLKSDKSGISWHIEHIHPAKLTSPEAGEVDSYPDPDVILIDYQLTNPGPSKKVSNLNGLDIATSIRVRHTSIPLFLYSYKTLAKLVPIQKEIADEIFDEILYKDNFTTSGISLIEHLNKICAAYSKINSISFTTSPEKDDRKEKLYSLLESPKQAYDDIDSLIGYITHSISDEWIPFRISFMIRKQLMANPGILYDSLHAATFLGISKTAFESIEGFFESAEYTGAFSDIGKFWWKCSLQEIADEIMEGDELRIPYSHGFHTAWKRKTGNDLELAKCIVSGETPAEWVCFILQEPVMIRYTLPYPNLICHFPAMDEPRVSFSAFLKNKINPLLLDKDSKLIFDKYVEELKKNAK